MPMAESLSVLAWHIRRVPPPPHKLRCFCWIFEFSMLSPLCKYIFTFFIGAHLQALEFENQLEKRYYVSLVTIRFLMG